MELRHRKSDINRSVYEGISFELALALEKYIKIVGTETRDIVITGGGSKSKFWRKMLSDIYNKRIILTNIGQNTAALGAAAIAAVGTGIWKDFSMVDEVTKKIDISKPKIENVKKYKEILKSFEYLIEKTGILNKNLVTKF